MRLEPGARFDRYRIEARLGEGGMGCVYRAYDEKLRRNVALKVLQVSADASDSSASQGAARLLREARAAAALDHPNAIAIFDVGEAGGPGDEAPVPYIAMGLILGRSLRAFVGRTDLTSRSAFAGWPTSRARWARPIVGVWSIATSSPRT